MLSATIETYGGPFIDEEPTDNPETQISADKFNRLAEDSAHMTRTAPRAIVEFLTNTTTNPPAGDVTHASVWGSGDAQKPTVTRGGVGLYAITYATSFSDALGDSEDVSFRFHDEPTVRVNDNTKYSAKVKTLTANTVTLAVFDGSATPALSDLSGAARVSIRLY